MNRRTPQITDAAMSLLVNFDWPGNVRDLQNCIERTILLTDSEVIRPEHLPHEVRSDPTMKSEEAGISVKPGVLLKDAEKAIILKTIEEVGGNKTKAAKLLGISLRGLQYKLKEYDREA